MPQKILAIDLGQSSIGWLIRDTNKIGGDQFDKFGVITFNKGVGEEKNVEFSLAAERTRFRSARRLYQSRKYRLWDTLKHLKANDYCPIQEKALLEWSRYDKEKGFFRKYPIWDKKFENWIKLDFNQDGKPDFESPYQLRKSLAEKKLDFTNSINRHMLGRALYHIAQHRGFKSSKKVKLDDVEKDKTDIGAEEKNKQKLKEAFNKLGIEFNEQYTIGQHLAQAETFFKKRGYGRIRNELHPLINRKMLQNEVEQIFEFQFGTKWHEDFHAIFGVDKISKASIFWQRPLRSQKSSVGKCTLEPNKFRCPASHPQYEIFRAWAFINNLKYKTDFHDYFQSLDIDLKNKLYQDEFIRANSFEVVKIRKWIIQQLNDKSVRLNFSDQTEIPGSPTIYYLSKILGPNWDTLKIKHPPIERIKKSKSTTKYISKKDYYDYEDIWHMAFQVDDTDELSEIGKNKLKFNENQLKAFIEMSNKMEVDHARLSLKALKNINYFLKKGLIYSDAVLLAKIPEIIGSETFNEEAENLIVSSFQTLISNYKKQKNIIQITNNLIAEYKINHFHERDYSYQLALDDIQNINKACTAFFGNSQWSVLPEDEKRLYFDSVKTEFQAYFQDSKRQFKKMPKLGDEIKNFIRDNFEGFDNKKISQLYHPSAIDIYPKLSDKNKAKDGKLYLPSPKTGSWKNPMAMRVLQELRILINYLIKTDQIDEETKIVVEIPRELNDANKRKAYEIWQKRQEEQNREYAKAISYLIKNNPHLKAGDQNTSDIEKFRLWYEQTFGEIESENTAKGKNELKPIKNKSLKNLKQDEEILIYTENRYSNLRSSIWFKLEQAKENVLKKYTLWMEQKAKCIYTGKMISLTDLFSEDQIDIEHTLPYSRSLDNSMANKTVCFKEYNRKIKQNRIPSECYNYDAILEAIKPWQDKIKSIKRHLDYWKRETKKASTPERKKQCIIEKHLWTWELEYWENKISRFLVKEITTGFVNAQLVETQIISKYAFHYLKTIFENVQVQKGSITAEFSKILGLRQKYKSKTRADHTHHIVDAFVLSLIPDSARLKSIIEKYGEINELEKSLSDIKQDERSLTLKRIEILNQEIQQLMHECQIPHSVLNHTINKIKAHTIAISKPKNNLFTSTKKKIKKGRLKGKYATGSTIRGQLHKDTFYGKIKLVERDSNDKPLRDENGNWKFALDKHNCEKFAFVKRIPVNEKLALERIVDPWVKRIFEQNLKTKSSKEITTEGGLIFHHPKTGKLTRIRHVRYFQRPTELLEIKRQSHISKYEYKNLYYCDNAQNIYYALYESKNGVRTFEMLNLFNAVQLKNATDIRQVKDFFAPSKHVGRGKKKEEALLKAILYPKQKVIFYKNSKDELYDLPLNEILKRTYNIYSLYGKTDGRIQLQHHLEARADKDITDPDNPEKKLIGYSSVDIDNLKTRYLLSLPNFNFAIEGYDFEIMPDGKLIWKRDGF